MIIKFKYLSALSLNRNGENKEYLSDRSEIISVYNDVGEWVKEMDVPISTAIIQKSRIQTDGWVSLESDGLMAIDTNFKFDVDMEYIKNYAIRLLRDNKLRDILDE
jgi:hypothetical protein